MGLKAVFAEDAAHSMLIRRAPRWLDCCEGASWNAQVLRQFWNFPDASRRNKAMFEFISKYATAVPVLVIASRKELEEIFQSGIREITNTKCLLLGDDQSTWRSTIAQATVKAGVNWP